jgi:hypothetical protein
MAADVAESVALGIAQIGQTSATTFESAIADDHSDRHAGHCHGKHARRNANR